MAKTRTHERSTHSAHRRCMREAARGERLVGVGQPDVDHAPGPPCLLPGDAEPERQRVPAVGPGLPFFQPPLAPRIARYEFRADRRRQRQRETDRKRRGCAGPCQAATMGSAWRPHRNSQRRVRRSFSSRVAGKGRLASGADRRPYRDRCRFNRRPSIPECRVRCHPRNPRPYRCPGDEHRHRCWARPLSRRSMKSSMWTR